MSKLAVIFKVLDWIMWLAGIARTAYYKKQGRKEVLTEIEVRNAEQAATMERITADVSGSSISSLEQRMSAHERRDP